MTKFKPFLNQNYDKIIEDLKSSGKQFEDPSFPANSSSLYKGSGNLDWKRPHQICNNPQFIVNDIEPNDLDQGILGDCWLISSIAALATVPEYAQIVIPTDQSFDKNYYGIFRFRLWRDGEWIEVVVDDRLPCHSNAGLAYCHNIVDANEFFGPLLEKAYAKANKSYNTLYGGPPVNALVDMTGGIHESRNIKEAKNLWDVIIRSLGMKSLIGATIHQKNGRGDEFKMANGLAAGHAYSVLAGYEIIQANGTFQLKTNLDEKSSADSTKLLKIRNPWGKAKSYQGKWSPNEKVWEKYPKDLLDIMEASEQVDGQFLVSMDEFVREFDQLDMVHVNPGAFIGKSEGANSNVHWISQKMHGSWKKGETAGSWAELWKNPQFLVSLKCENNLDTKISMIVSLFQPIGHINNAPIEAAAFYVYKVLDGVPKKAKYTQNELSKIFESVYEYKRELTEKLDLEPGDYVIIPSLYKKDVEANFMIRLFIEGKQDLNFKGVNLNYKKREKKDKNQNENKDDQPKPDNEQKPDNQQNKTIKIQHKDKIKEQTQEELDENADQYQDEGEVVDNYNENNENTDEQANDEYGYENGYDEYEYDENEYDEYDEEYYDECEDQENYKNEEEYYEEENPDEATHVIINKNTSSACLLM